MHVELVSAVRGQEGRHERRTSAATYDAWLTVLRSAQPRFEFTDPPFRHSLPMTLAFAATASRPVAVLTGPLHPTGPGTTRSRRARSMDRDRYSACALPGRRSVIRR